jgi:hypothetical protein
MSDERYSPLMLVSEHKRILQTAQARYDEKIIDLYARGRWDGVAVGIFVGFVIGIMTMLGVIGLAQGWIR